MGTPIWGDQTPSGMHHNKKEEIDPDDPLLREYDEEDRYWEVGLLEELVGRTNKGRQPDSWREGRGVHEMTQEPGAISPSTSTLRTVSSSSGSHRIVSNTTPPPGPLTEKLDRDVSGGRLNFSQISSGALSRTGSPREGSPSTRCGRRSRLRGEGGRKSIKPGRVDSA